MRTYIFALCFLFVFAASGCGSPRQTIQTPTPTPTPRASPTPTVPPGLRQEQDERTKAIVAKICERNPWSCGTFDPYPPPILFTDKMVEAYEAGATVSCNWLRDDLPLITKYPRLIDLLLGVDEDYHLEWCKQHAKRLVEDEVYIKESGDILMYIPEYMRSDDPETTALQIGFMDGCTHSLVSWIRETSSNDSLDEIDALMLIVTCARLLDNTLGLGGQPTSTESQPGRLETDSSEGNTDEAPIGLAKTPRSAFGVDKSGVSRSGAVQVDIATPQPSPASSTPNCEGGCIEYPEWCAPPIKGNVSFNSGEKIYHVPGQEYYDDTKIDPRYDERWFCTEAEARAAGWRKSKQ